ncbi:transcription repressor OFP8-like [Cynara cardunculus var. scolymus]|uniref:Transcription repressor n=1 Tax=Cynara cardunculus var. scolymus TaxID=59895 RepID=A0A103Y2D0_CYNCS|nr:transcription repressor OFP8-like [Cynara cardunculus var. scolymus]KVI01265.1 Ovate protein family, C-terminal [Cynara cardunculus var. scolymus]
MENRFKLQISKLLQSTLNSCRPKNNSDVSDHHLFFLKNPHHRRLIDLFSPKPQPPSSSQPKLHLNRLGTTPFPAYTDRRRPQSISPPFHEKPTKRDRKKKPHYRKRRNNPSFSSITDNYYYNWWSSDEDNQSDGKTTLFSRRSVSSDSFESIRKNRTRRIAAAAGGGGGCRDTEVVAMDGFAVAKESKDPHEDFRSSMVDMIVEKGIFGVEELENLVECFLSLNSEEHHKVIFEVFAEIWETLISDLGKKE